MRLTAQLQRWFIYAAFAALTTGCTTKFYRESADKEAYKAIRNKAPAVPNMDTNFTIEQTNLVSLAFLKPQLDLVSSVSLRSPPNKRAGVPVPDVDRYSWSAGLDLDLPLDRKSERSAYRAALIAEKQAARAFEQNADESRVAPEHANRSARPRPPIEETARGESVAVRRGGVGVAIASEMRIHVLRREPQNVGPLRRSAKLSARRMCTKGRRHKGVS